MKLGRKPKLAVTGARGRIATELASHLRARGFEVELFSRHTAGIFADTLSLANPERLGDFECVLHLGWSSVPLSSETHPGIEEREDFPFVGSLVKAATKNRAKPKLVFFSTAAVYGNTGDEPATEKTRSAPIGRYAAAKLHAEHMFLSYPNACVLRITNVLGFCSGSRRPQGILPIIAQALQAGSGALIWGDGSAVKDYIAFQDLHRAVESVISDDLSGIFNVASGSSLSVRDLFQIVEQSCGRRIQKQFLPAYPWDVKTAHISSRKIQMATGWKPRITPHDFVSDFASSLSAGK